MARNFQGDGVRQGSHFESECLMALELAGFEIADHHLHLADVGVNLDVVTNNKYDVAMAWELKGSWQGVRPGLRRTDTVKKALANAWLLQHSSVRDMFPPLLIMTSHEPERGDAEAMLRTAIGGGLILGVIDSRDGMRLKELFEAQEGDIRRMLDRTLFPLYMLEGN